MLFCVISLQIYNIFFIFAHRMKKVIRKILFSVLMLWTVLPIVAQSVRLEILADVRCVAGNYRAYPGPHKSLSAAPRGMHPFYISHYGCSGSHHHTKPSYYDSPWRTLTTADSLGKLTALGRDVLERVQRIRDEAKNHWGELTAVGAAQQTAIVRRLFERFPEVMGGGKTVVDARSTMAGRNILSMEHAMLELSRQNPRLKTHHNATHRDANFLNFFDRRLLAKQMDSTAQACYDAFVQQYPTHERLMRLLFCDADYVSRHVNAAELTEQLFKMAAHPQNGTLGDSVSLYDIFTADEIYTNWQKLNAWWYLAYGNTPANKGLQPFSQRNLLRKIIADADSLIRGEGTAVQLRFGSETAIMPLACLLDINGYGLSTTDLAGLAKAGWVNYRIFPMAANIQFVFYRRKAGDTDVLFKVLYNEEEATLPLPTRQSPYYRWSDFREYYLKKLDGYKE